MGGYRVLERQKARKESDKVRFYYWDIESWGLNPSDPAFIMVMPEKRYHKNMKEEYYFKDGASMLAWIDKLPKSYRHVFYAHNGNKFDIYALFDTEAIIDMPKLANPSTVFQFQYGQNVFFKDSLQLLSAPLASYGAKGITPKKFIDPNDPDYGNKDSITEQDIEYCRQDVVILRDAITTLRSLYQEWVGMENAGLPLTCASMAYRVWCSRYWPSEWSFETKNGKIKHLVAFKEEAANCAKEAFFGGRVMVFPNLAGVEVNNAMSYDRNSMYPAEMLKMYPNPNVCFKANPTIGRVKRLKKQGVPYWGRFVLKWKEEGELFLPAIVNKKAFYLGKAFDGALMYPELNYALENGWELVEVKELWRSEGIELFKEYVEYFYNLRLEMKKNGDQREKFCKVLLNSLFGKFGSKDRHERIESWEEKEKIKKKEYPEGETWHDHYDSKFWTNDPNDGSYFVSKEATIKPRCQFFPIAAAITSNARVELQSNIARCQAEGFKVVYCDTDSVHLYDLGNKKPPFEIGSALGQWDLERPKGSTADVVPSAIYYERKAYTWKDRNGRRIKIKHKGVSKSDGDLTKAQTNVSVRKYKTAKRRGLEAGVEVHTVKKSKKWFNENEVSEEKS